MSNWRGLRGALIWAGACTCWVQLAGSQEPTGLASRVDALIGQGAVRDAVVLFDASADATRSVDVIVLQRLARAVLSQVAAQPVDPAASLEACLTLIEAASDPCESAVLPSAEKSVAPVIRLRALARKLRVGSPQAERQLAQLTENFGPRDWVAVVDAAGDFPPPLAVALLGRALAGGSEDVQYGALQTLAAIDHPSALPLLKTWAGRSNTPGHLLAVAAVARSGDAAALETIGRLLPELEGQDLLSAGMALAARHDPRGKQALYQVLRGPEELLHLEAAAALAHLGDPAGRSRLEAELTNANPWIRLRTLEKLRSVSTTPAAPIWRQMTDPMPWIRVRAAQATLASCRAQSSPAAR